MIWQNNLIYLVLQVSLLVDYENMSEKYTEYKNARKEYKNDKTYYNFQRFHEIHEDSIL